eukprot:CAMPEP_0115872670 /NCGR_PEP_ID=MMETSP0287-20121206/23554_1 /TAXON_ID=412157 /ORGANISM="Chrysochromulina rotalis, Strain UIO044" /LENGTH=76 /DNA_ID=CAMNT_0003327615 /DNA_START=306 /DNA_END=536 /DNA_ORIENTATION=+
MNGWSGIPISFAMNDTLRASNRSSIMICSASLPFERMLRSKADGKLQFCCPSTGLSPLLMAVAHIEVPPALCTCAK